MIPPEQKQFLIASIIPSRLSQEETFQDLKEMKELVDSYAGVVVDYVLQNREVHDKGLYLGAGKIHEIGSSIKEKNIDVVVLNAIVKPGHIFDIKKSLERYKPSIEVWDRVDLILQIFSKHAHTTEARLQIELAAMRHMGPRIYGMGYVLSRQGGSIGTRGIGETNTELMKRHWRNQMKKTEDKLKKLAGQRERQLEQRRKMGVQTISLVGYTNAGKTSLFNLLTGKEQLVQNALFATLDSHVGKLYIPHTKQKVLVSDTIGFIRNLPADLIKAFRSTLLESLSADLLVHVVDASDPDLGRKLHAVKAVLKELNVFTKPTLHVFNKADQLTPVELTRLSEKYAIEQPLFISVNKEQGINELLLKIDSSVNTIPVMIPSSQQ